MSGPVKRDRVQITPQELKEKAEKRREDLVRAKKSSARKQRLLSLSWQRTSKERSMKDVLDFFERRIEMNVTSASDGVAYEADGKTVVRFSSDQRLALLDRNAGIREVVDYIRRHMEP